MTSINSNPLWRLSGYRLGELPVLMAPRQSGKRIRTQELKRALAGVPKEVELSRWWYGFNSSSPPKITLVAHLVGCSPIHTTPTHLRPYSFRKEIV